MKRKAFLIVLVLGFALICSSAKADFYVIAAGGRLIGTEIKFLPYTITSSGFYYIKKDLTSIGSGIIVESDNVTIDLMGYSLIGPGSGSGNGIYMDDRNNVEIRNGTIKEFGSEGIFENSDTGKAHRVISVRSLLNGRSGIYLLGSGHLVKDCTVVENGLFGLRTFYGSTVTGNTAYNNQASGIVGGIGNTVTGNTAYNNQSDGVNVSHSSTVTGNTAYNNQRNGIATSLATVTGNTANNNQDSGIYAGIGSTVTGNTFRNNNQSDDVNAAGIEVHGNCLVKNNNATANKQNNIWVFGSNNIIEENLVTDSTNGIYFNPANTTGNFYANNRASDNITNYANTSGNIDGGGNVEF